MRDVDVPPVGVGGDQLHGLAPGAADDERDPVQGHGLLLGAVEVEVLALVVDDLAAPEGGDDLERLLQPAHPGPRLGRPDAEGLELGGHRPPAEAELEAATGGVVECDRLAGEHDGVAERVAQHERSDAEVVGVGGQPRVGHHRFEHRGGLGEGWREMVHAGDPGEPRRLRPLGARHHLGHRHAHLGHVEPELGSGHECTTLLSAPASPRVVCQGGPGLAATSSEARSHAASSAAAS